MVIQKKVSEVNVFTGSPWEVDSVKTLLNAAYISVSVREEGGKIKLLVPGEYYSAAINLISNRKVS